MCTNKYLECIWRKNQYVTSYPISYVLIFISINKSVCRYTDKHSITVYIWLYFLCGIFFCSKCLYVLFIIPHACDISFDLCFIYLIYCSIPNPIVSILANYKFCWFESKQIKEDDDLICSFLKCYYD